MDHMRITNLKEALHFIGIESLSQYLEKNGLEGDYNLEDEEDLARLEKLVMKDARRFRDWVQEDGG
jgi:hypothetical protein